MHVYKTLWMAVLIRISMKLSCTMYLEKFPLDYQICYIKISTCKLYGVLSLIEMKSSLYVGLSVLHSIAADSCYQCRNLKECHSPGVK